MLDEEQQLIARLRKIEALFARPGTEGERRAAEHASNRIRARLTALKEIEPAVEICLCARMIQNLRSTFGTLRVRLTVAACVACPSGRPHPFQCHGALAIFDTTQLLDDMRLECHRLIPLGSCLAEPL